MTSLLDLLPPTLAEIHNLFGIEVMLKLWKRFGGTHVYVPAKPKADNPLVDCLGNDAKAFCKHYSGEWLIVPKATKLQMQLRNQLISEAVQGGDRLAVVALRFNLAERQIQRIAANVVSEEQKDLFE